MADYPGGWGVALVDLDCGIELAVRPEHFQYTASAGKIVPVIAALRAVDASRVSMPRPWTSGPFACGVTRDPGTKPGDPIELEELEPALFLVMRHSCDQEADLINRMVTPQQIADVLKIANVSQRTRFEHSWRFGGMTALDLARVWAALLGGRLLDMSLTTYLLDLTSRAEIPEGLDTFPTAPDIPGHQFGQKAGYCIVCPPYSLIALGAGHIRSVDQLSAAESVGGTRGTIHRGVAIVLMAQTTAPGGGPQRRDVFPLLLAYVLGEG